MREILFRGQTRKYGEKVRMGDGQKLPGHWVYGGVLQGVGSHSIIYGGENVEDPSEGLDKWCVHTDTLGQFTGLTDKNGKKIFEGDIVRCGTGRICKVNFFISPGVSGFDLVAIGGFDAPSPHNWALFSDTEVIGNIHENPELLETP